MVYLWNMVIFHGYVSHNQMVNPPFVRSIWQPQRCIWCSLRTSGDKPLKDPRLSPSHDEQKCVSHQNAVSVLWMKKASGSIQLFMVALTSLTPPWFSSLKLVGYSEGKNCTSELCQAFSRLFEDVLPQDLDGIPTLCWIWNLVFHPDLGGVASTKPHLAA